MSRHPARGRRCAPGFLAACELWLIETSPPLRARQAARLAGAGPRWASSPRRTPARRADAPGRQRAAGLPARAPVPAHGARLGRAGGGAGRGRRARLRPSPRRRRLPATPPVGAVIERSAAQEAFAAELGGRHRAAGRRGAADRLRRGPTPRPRRHAAGPGRPPQGRSAGAPGRSRPHRPRRLPRGPGSRARHRRAGPAC